MDWMFRQEAMFNRIFNCARCHQNGSKCMGIIASTCVNLLEIFMQKKAGGCITLSRDKAHSIQPFLFQRTWKYWVTLEYISERMLSWSHKKVENRIVQPMTDTQIRHTIWGLTLSTAEKYCTWNTQSNRLRWCALLCSLKLPISVLIMFMLSCSWCNNWADWAAAFSVSRTSV